MAALLPWLVYWDRSEPACRAEPVGFDRLNAVVTAAPPPAEPGGLPGGVRAATPGEATALRGVLDEFVACGDTGEPLRVFALYTDRYLGELHYRQGPFTAEQYRSLARPDPSEPEEETRLISVEEVEVLVDGRVAGEAVIRYAAIPEPKRFLVTVAEVDEAWRIDDILGELTFALP